MPFDIVQFRAQMQGDGARPNLFEVTMPFPAAVVPNTGQAITKMTFMARSAQLPGVSIGTVPLQYFGRAVNLAGNAVYGEWQTTIHNDEDFVGRRAIEQWMNGINSHEGNLRDPAFRNSFGYTVDAYVNQFAKTGEVIKNYKFVGLFPVDLSPIDLDWAANDTIEEFSVTWQLQYWTDISSGVV